MNLLESLRFKHAHDPVLLSGLFLFTFQLNL
jgi:hypothetical protein